MLWLHIFIAQAINPLSGISTMLPREPDSAPPRHSVQ